MAGAEDMMLPVQRVEMDSDALGASGEQTSVARGAALLFPLGEPFTVVGRGAAAVLRIPSAENTVAATARRWGFSRPDRFAAAYRTVYGRPPGHTLRR